MLSLRLILLALAAATLTSVAPAGAAEPLTGAALKAACQEARGDAYRLLLSPEVTRQGSTVAGQGVMRGPNAPWGGPLPLACLKNWKLSATAMATLSADHGGLVISDDAVPGAKIRLTAEFDGQIVAAEFTVVARAAVVLTGHWTEVGDAQCLAGDTLLRELHLKANGQFEVTWMPFETYVDYWGDYQFDPATGAVSFTPTGGNYRPPDADLTGRASLGPDGLLRLSDLFFGSPRSGGVSPSACGLVFKSR